jgi:hypothetical protein
MGNSRIEAGWRRFLDRLKRLWGKRGDIPKTAVITTVTHVR